MNTTSDKYDMKNDREHVLTRPDTYVGSNKQTEENMFIFHNNLIIEKKISFVPGLYKIFDEILVNARDVTITDETCDTIKVNIDREKNEIKVWNNGQGIPVTKHTNFGLWIPDMIFGNLRSSTNFDDNQDKITGGRNGLGAKLANIFSTKFIVETISVEYGKKYYQEYTDNMLNKSEPKISSCKTKKGYCCITFYPDLEKFGLKELSEDIVSLFKKRVYDLVACTKKIKIYFNEEKLEINNFKQYIRMYYPDSEPIIEETDRWKVGVIFNMDGEHRQISFANGICTYNGGTHVDYILNPLLKNIQDEVKKKTKDGNSIKNNDIKDNIILFVDSVVVNPSFTSQTKETLSLKPKEFGSTFELSSNFLKKIYNTGIITYLKELNNSKQNIGLQKMNAKKRKRITGISKLEDATLAGTDKSNTCKLFLAEGDSAKAMVMAGLSIIGNEKYGVFPLKGKPLNVRDVPNAKVQQNEEIKNIVTILGLEFGKVYKSLSELRYGGVVGVFDQDYDGFHIKGLFINFLHKYWPSLLKLGFFYVLNTPIVKIFKGQNKIEFYNVPDFEQWKKDTQDNHTYRIKYYKGLGTSNRDEAREYFNDVENKLVLYQPEEDDNLTEDTITLGFLKERANDRKVWLSNYDRNDVLSVANKTVSISDFINKELIHFSIEDNDRSIPSLVDGMKPSQRKAIYSAIHKRLFSKNDEIRVSQLAGYTSDITAYHHGEAAMNKTIISLARNFIGSNNINLLYPSGMFGTRLLGGEDASSPRYINVYLEELTRIILNPLDDVLLNYLNDDGKQIEPEYYVPIIPIILCNGTVGIGTGYSTSIPNYNPEDIISNLINLIDGKEYQKMSPWYRNFLGEISPITEDTYTVKGNYSIKANKVTITELPVGTWTTPYKEYLENMLNNDSKSKDKKKKNANILQSYTTKSTDNTVHLELVCDKIVLQEMINSDQLEDVLKLKNTIKTTNMHLFNHKGKITKYDSEEMILKEFYTIRLEYYSKRKAYLIDKIGKELDSLNNKMKFIILVVEEKIKINNQKENIIIEKIKSYDIPPENNSYDYLLTIPLRSLTMEKVDEFKKKLDSKRKELDIIIKTTELEQYKKELIELRDKYKKFIK